MAFAPPSKDCPLCPRLAVFRDDNRRQHPTFFNGPVPSFGELGAEMLVVGLAPGLKGANRTGRPFTGDYAGLVLYSSLEKCGFAEGKYDPEKVAVHADQSADGFRLNNCRITNGVRCVPQANKPEPSEIKQCNGFLAAEIRAMPNLKVILSLGQIAHKAVLMAFGLKQSAFAFGHGREHLIGQPRISLSLRERLGEGQKVPYGKTVPHPIPLPEGEGTQSNGMHLFNSYHCSRYNINTGALTQAMFDEVMLRVKNKLAA